jgi:hypothetical protein
VGLPSQGAGEFPHQVVCAVACEEQHVRLGCLHRVREPTHGVGLAPVHRHDMYGNVDALRALLSVSTLGCAG